jgi:N-formylglutamate amidohydrolase
MDDHRPRPFELVPPAREPSRPVVLHVPHAGTRIPDDVRAGIALDEPALQGQLLQLTDWHTDRLFGGLTDAGAWAFINRLSRLVVDPERFADDALEPAATYGQGAVYTRTTDGRPLRDADAEARARLLADWFDPYHVALTDLVQGVLDAHGRCLIVDGHSFATHPLPNEPDQAPDRPDICIGTDATHTPPALAEALEDAFRRQGFRVARDTPFSGALVPLRHHGRGRRVTSVMIEVRRGLYLHEATGEPLPGFRAVRDRILAAILTLEAFAGAR